MATNSGKKLIHFKAGIIYCIYLNFFIFKLTFALRSKLKLFILISHVSSESRKLWELDNLPGFSSGLHGVQQELPKLSRAVNCPCLLSLHNISPSMPTTHSALHFHKSFGHMQPFSEILFKKCSGVSQVLLSNMKNPG